MITPFSTGTSPNRCLPQLAALLSLVLCADASATQHYVSTTGSDSYTPAQLGASGSEVTFQPTKSDGVHNDVVWIAGTMPLTNVWSAFTGPKGSFYNAEGLVPAGSSEVITQVFVDGVAMIESRWPQNGLYIDGTTKADLSHPTKSTIEKLVYTTLQSEDPTLKLTSYGTFETMKPGTTPPRS